MFSLQATWDDSAQFIKRERHLLMPLSLATLGLGTMVANLVQSSDVGQSVTTTNGLQALMFIAVIWAAIGKLSIIALTLREQCSVGEALRQGARRFVPFFGLAMLFSVAVTIVALPIIIELIPQATALQRNDLTHLHLSTGASLWTLAIVLVVLFFNARLYVLPATVVDQKGNLFGLVKQSFQATRGSVWPLLGFLLGFSLFTLLLNWAVAASFGSLFAILGKLLDSPFTAKVLESLVLAILAAGLGVIEAVFTAKAYQKLVLRR